MRRSMSRFMSARNLRASSAPGVDCAERSADPASAAATTRAESTRFIVLSLQGPATRTRDQLRLRGFALSSFRRLQWPGWLGGAAPCGLDQLANLCATLYPALASDLVA